MSREGMLWLAAIAAALLVYGAWVTRVRHLFHQVPAATATYDDQALALYLNDALGPRAKTACTTCDAHQERILLDLQHWVVNVARLRQSKEAR